MFFYLQIAFYFYPYRNQVMYKFLLAVHKMIIAFMNWYSYYLYILECLYLFPSSSTTISLHTMLNSPIGKMEKISFYFSFGSLDIQLETCQGLYVIEHITFWKSSHFLLVWHVMFLWFFYKSYIWFLQFCSYISFCSLVYFFW